MTNQSPKQDKCECKCHDWSNAITLINGENCGKCQDRHSSPTPQLPSKSPTKIEKKCECICHESDAVRGYPFSGYCDPCVNKDCSECRVPTPTWQEEFEDSVNDALFQLIRNTRPLSPKEKYLNARLQALEDILHANKKVESQALERGRREGGEMIRLILPLAKGYVAQHKFGSNQRYVEQAENFITNPSDKTNDPAHK